LDGASVIDVAWRASEGKDPSSSSRFHMGSSVLDGAVHHVRVRHSDAPPRDSC
jgi:hypothetical protein